MTRITDTIVATLEWAARRFDDVGIETVVRFGSPRREIVTEIEVVEPGFVACFTAQGGSPLERLRVWALRRQLARASARVLVVETPARRAPGPRRVLDQPALSTRGENGG